MNVSRRNFTACSVAAAGTAALTRTAKGAAQLRANIDVIVLGAGASGLQAAWLLEQQGARVLVLEGRQRVGGRVYTLMDQPGTPEMGFNVMSAGYGRAIDAAKRAGVSLYDVSPRYAEDYPMALVIGGRLVSPAAWAASPANPFSGPMRKMMPWEVVSRTMAAHNPLQNWAEWLSPGNAKLDVSLYSYLRAQGLSDAAIKMAYNTSPEFGTNAEDVSALLLEFNAGWEKTQIAAGPQQFAVKGGNQKLTDGMAALLQGDALLGKRVTGISDQGTKISVHCQDGSRYHARHVVCSLPFSTLQKLAIEPVLPSKQALAVRSLPYQPVSVAFLTVKSPFWEKDGLPPTMWTDGELGLVLPQHFGKSPADVTGIIVQARGGVAQKWDQLGHEGAMAMIVKQLETIRPAARGQVKTAFLQSWTTDPYNLGDWPYFAPGQIAEFAATMAAPAGNIHFCGEHTATANRGLEGAFESAERVAVEILTG